MLRSLLFSILLFSATSFAQTNTGVCYEGNTALKVKRAIITANASGDNLVVTAVAAKKLVLISARVISSGTVNVKFRSNTTDIDGLAYLIANSGYVLPQNCSGWMVTEAGQNLNLNLSAAIPVGGIVTYVEAN